MSIISIDELHKRSDHRTTPVVKLISASERSEQGSRASEASEYERKLPVKRAAEAIKDPRDIEKIISYLKDKAQTGTESDWRNYLLFVTGINFGLRASDLLS